MSTWDSMSDADYAACVDAGRGPAPDPRDLYDEAIKEAQENGEALRTNMPPKCPRNHEGCRVKFNGGNLCCLTCDLDGVELGIISEYRPVINVDEHIEPDGTRTFRVR